MSKKDGKPCKKCGTSEWYESRACKECMREYHRKWRHANPEKARERNRRWARNNLEYYRKYGREWTRNNPDKKVAKDNRRRTAKTKAGGSYTAAEFKALCDQYDNRCLCCGKKNKLAADHVVPVIKGGTSDISNIQPLCKSCNSRKHDKTIDYRTKPGILRWIQKRLFVL